MKKTNIKLLPKPTEVSEVDRLRLAVAAERSARARLVFEMAMTQENELKTQLRMRYRMSDTDTYNTETGAIDRTPPKPEAPSGKTA